MYAPVLLCSQWTAGEMRRGRNEDCDRIGGAVMSIIVSQECADQGGRMADLL